MGFISTFIRKNHIIGSESASGWAARSPWSRKMSAPLQSVAPCALRIMQNRGKQLASSCPPSLSRPLVAPPQGSTSVLGATVWTSVNSVASHMRTKEQVSDLCLLAGGWWF